MQKKYSYSLFIFRRDLRLEDNTALIAALQQSESVVPCFIFDPRQIGSQNKFRSAHAIKFMNCSLKSLDSELRKHGSRLILMEGVADECVQQVLKRYNDIEAVFVNADYTPFSKARDAAIQKVCAAAKVDFHSLGDALLHAPNEILKLDGQPYTIFTPYYKKALYKPVAKPIGISRPTFLQGTVRFQHEVDLPNSSGAGGRKEGLKLLKIAQGLKNYDRTRDIPSIDTSLLSPHLKFGTLSAREVYWGLADALGKGHSLVRQLFWRDFYTQILFHFPHVLTGPYHEKYRDLPWAWDEDRFAKWQHGMTGFPIVDAGMRQLNQTGFMHNRVRMIAASLLIKDLHINWQDGERYFAQQLTDYDPALNNGNWQWVASTGADCQPYFRIFNPWLQQKKFDHECAYIKKWVPELQDAAARDIHNWFTTWAKYPGMKYPKPIVDHTKESAKAKAAYARANKK